MNASRKFAGYLTLAAVLVAADQVTKQFALTVLATGAVDILPFLSFALVFNRGAAFGFLADAGGWQTAFLISLTVVLTVVLTVWLWRAAGRGEKLLSLGLALVLGGAIGNLVDRAVYQFVIDFIVVHYRGWQFPAFNLADSAITIGAVLLIIEHLFGDGGDGDGDGDDPHPRHPRSLLSGGRNRQP